MTDSATKHVPGEPARETGGRRILRKEARLEALWSARLANQMSELPPFDQVFREFRRTLRQSGLS